MEKEQTYKYVNVKKKNYFSKCSKEMKGGSHHDDNEPKKYSITPGFVIAWL